MFILHYYLCLTKILTLNIIKIEQSNKFLTKVIYLDAKFPKDFCLANAAQLLGAKGCQEFIVDLCSSDPSLASSPQCAGQLYHLI